jgi:hypothetical protein
MVLRSLRVFCKPNAEFVTEEEELDERSWQSILKHFQKQCFPSTPLEVVWLKRIENGAAIINDISAEI